MIKINDFTVLTDKDITLGNKHSPPDIAFSFPCPGCHKNLTVRFSQLSVREEVNEFVFDTPLRTVTSIGSFCLHHLNCWHEYMYIKKSKKTMEIRKRWWAWYRSKPELAEKVLNK